MRLQDTSLLYAMPLFNDTGFGGGDSNRREKDIDQTMIIVADNLQVIDPSVSEAVDQRNPDPIKRLVRSCVSAGADAIDINPGPLKKNAAEIMTFLVETVQSVTPKPLLLDTTSAEAIEAGLLASKNKAVINGFSLEPQKCLAILPLAKAFDVDIIAYVLYPDSAVPTDEGGFFEITMELIDRAQNAGVPLNRLIIDPVVAPLIWADGAAHNRSLLSFLHRLDDLAGLPVRRIAGLSNLTTGRAPKEKKRLAQRTFLPMMAAAGLDMILMQVFNEDIVRTARACDAMTGEKIFSWAALA